MIAPTVGPPARIARSKTATRMAIAEPRSETRARVTISDERIGKMKAAETPPTIAAATNSTVLSAEANNPNATEFAATAGPRTRF